MQTKVQKWGDSLVLRIPKFLATETNLQHDASVDLSLVDGKLVVTPINKPELTLEQLLEGVTEDNIHGEIDIGFPVGKEVW